MKPAWMKGPWWIEKRDGRWQIQTAHGGPGSSFCIAAVNQWTYGAEETALLVAAAPELAEALANTLRLAEEKFEIAPSPREQDIIDEARAALAKARGEAAQ